MNRLKGYLIHLGIPALLPLMMIYYPEKLDGLFNFLASDSGINAVIVFVIILWCFLYYQFSKGFSAELKGLKFIFKSYMLFSGLFAVYYLNSVGHVSAFRDVILLTLPMWVILYFAHKDNKSNK
jgi:L-asparagine transporter-like permease